MVETILIDKILFCEKVKSQITLGKSFCKKQIDSEGDLFSLRNDSMLWSDYNVELLKRSFNNSDNEYFNSYKNILIIGYLGNHTLADKAKSCKEKLQKQIQFLESLLNRIDLIK